MIKMIYSQNSVPPNISAGSVTNSYEAQETSLGLDIYSTVHNEA